MNDNSEVPTDGKADTEDDRECFMIAPIGSDSSPTRERTENLLDFVIQPVVEEDLGLKVTVAHKIDKPGNITRQVMELLFEAELVIADLTEHNANVMYELAVRHATGEPVVTIAQKGMKPPFDIGPQRTKFYKNTLGGVKDFKPKLRSAVRATLEEEHEPDNPIYRVRKDFAMREAAAGDDKMGFILDRLDNIESSLSHAVKSERNHSSNVERGVFNHLEMLVDGPDASLEKLPERLEKVGKDFGVPFSAVLEPGEDHHRLVLYGGGIHHDNFLQLGDAVTKEIEESDVEIL